MIETLLVAVGMTVGVDWRLLLLVGAALWFPVPAAVALVIVGVAQRGVRSGSFGDETRVVEATIGELRAGASLRSAFLVAFRDRERTGRIVRRLQVGEPLPDAITGLDRALPTIGKLVEVAVGAGGTGGRMLPVFEELLVHVSAEAEAEAEMRAALAPVRASMTVLVGAPAVYLAWSAASGRLGRLLQLPGGAWLAGTGGLLFVVGITAMWLIARRRR